MPVAATYHRLATLRRSVASSTLLRSVANLALLALLVAGASGCVERRMVIVTDPYPVAANAIVYDEKNQPLGGTPVDKPFTYYGKYRFRIVKDGFETLDIEENVRAPWYEWPGLDFISENLIPWTIRDRREFRYVMQPALVRPPENLLREGELLRDYASGVGTPGFEPAVMPATYLGAPIRDR